MKNPREILLVIFVFVSYFILLFMLFYGILLTIEANLNPRPGVFNNPYSGTKSLLSDLINMPGALRYTPEVVFKPEDVLASSAFVERLSISADQICMSTGQFAEDTANGFECIGCEDAGDNQRLVYHGKANRAAKIAIVCNVNLTELEADIDAYGLEYDTGTSIKEACAVCEGKGKCCAIVLKRS